MENLNSKIAAAPRVRLGELIEIDEEINSKNLDLPFYGVNKDKEFMPTIANTDGLKKNKYKIIRKGQFIFSGMQTGRDMCVRFALYDEENPVLVSPAYTTLRLKSDTDALVEYIFVYFLSSERDRLGAFYSDASVRANLELYRFFEIEIPLPGIEVQRDYVAAYRSLLALARHNEALIKPLQNACNAFLTKAQTQYKKVSLCNLISSYDNRNSSNVYGANEVRGLATSKQLIETKANLVGVSLSSYKIFEPHTFAYVEDTTRRGDKMSMAMNTTDRSWLLSSISTLFRVKDENVLSSEYLYLNLCRTEFDRLARFNSWGSARETFPFSEMQNVKIPLPPIEVQRSIVALYRCAEEARSIAAEARRQLKLLCPAMVQRAANSQTATA